MESDGIYNAYIKPLEELFERYYKSKEDLNTETLLEIDFNLLQDIIQSSKEKVAKGAILYVFLKEDCLKILHNIVVSSRDLELRRFIESVLIEKKDIKTLKLMIYLANQGSLINRRKLLETIGEIAPNDDKKVEDLFRRFLMYGDQNSVEGALIGAGKLKNMNLLPEIISCLNKHTSEYVRIAAVEALDNYKHLGEVTDLLKNISKNDLYDLVRIKAAESLSSF